MQAWLNTSSSVSQTRSMWHLGSIPPAGAPSKELAPGAKWPCCSTHLIPRFTASRLSDVSPLCGNTTHRANHCPALVHHHSDIPFIIPSIHWPAPTPGSPAFMNWQRAETSMGYHANAGIQGRKQSWPFSRCAVAHSDNSQTREAMKTNLCCWVIFIENYNESGKAVEMDAGVRNVRVKRGFFVVRMILENKQLQT